MITVDLGFSRSYSDSVSHFNFKHNIQNCASIEQIGLNILDMKFLINCLYSLNIVLAEELTDILEVKYLDHFRYLANILEIEKSAKRWEIESSCQQKTHTKSHMKD